MPTRTTSAVPSIFVGAATNPVKGGWVNNIGQYKDVRELETAIENTLRGAGVNPDTQEWIIADYEGFGGFDLSETEDLEDVYNLVCGIEQHGVAFALYCSHVGEIVDEDRFLQAFRGEYPSSADYAEELAEETGDLKAVPEYLRPYIDFDALARDMEYSGDIEVMTVTGEYEKVFIFDNHI